MALALNIDHLKRYREIAALLVKYGRSGALRDAANADPLAGANTAVDPQAEKDAQELASDLERMGPIFVKLGQVLSARTDLLPPAYIDALSRLQDDIELFPYDEVEEIIESELAVRISKAFRDFEREPIGSASLGQVHRAALRDGRPVAVKVQRPGIRAQIATDMEALEKIAELAESYTEAGRRLHMTDILAEFRRDLIRELDYRIEARNLAQIGSNLAEFPNILVPSPIDDFTTSRVLTMDYIRGTKITDMSPLARLEMDGEQLVEELSRAYLKQILVDGLFHADPHPGNVLITENHKLALVDLGMVGRLTAGMQQQLLKLLLAVSEGSGDTAADVAIEMSELEEDFDEAEFRRVVGDLVTEYHGASIEAMQVGRAIVQLSQSTSNTGVRLPSELTMFGKTLLNLDEIERLLAPDFDPNEAIRRSAAEITRRRIMKTISPGNLFSGLMEAQELASEMPRRVNRILDLLTKNELEIRVNAIDEGTLIEGFQKVANRIATGLVLAALIVGASMLMRVETRFQILGYPGLAMIFFLVAAGLGLWLVIDILLADRAARPGG